MKASGRGVEPFVVGRSSNLGSDGPQFAGRVVARKNLPSYKNRYAKSHNGLPSHSCPFWQPSCASRRSAPDGPKRLGTAPTHKAVGRVFFLRSAVCELRPAKFPSLPVIILAIVVLVIVILAVVVLVIVILAVVIGVIPIPVVIAFDPFLFFVPFVEFVQDKACADG